MNSYHQEFENLLKLRGFTYGGGRIDPKNQFFYVNIPKNASNYLDRLFSHSGWNVANLLDIDVRQVRCIVVLRDPVERWLSAITQYAASTLGEHMGQPFVDAYNPVLEKILFDQVVFDDHTMPQYYFFDRAKYQYNVEYFWHDDSLVQRMSHRYGLRLDQEFEGNETSSDANKKIVVDFLRSRINNNKTLLQAVKSRYREDYRLINRIQFQ